jgi:hypothetical protein
MARKLEVLRRGTVINAIRSLVVICGRGRLVSRSGLVATSQAAVLTSVLGFRTTVREPVELPLGSPCFLSLLLVSGEL